jgi:hypothetical protein
MERSKNILTNHSTNLDIYDFVELFLAVSAYCSKTECINPVKLYTARINDNYLKTLDYITLIYYACRRGFYEKGLFELNIVDNKDNLWMRLIGDAHSSRYLDKPLEQALKKFEKTYGTYPLYSERDKATVLPLGEETTMAILDKYDPKLISDMNSIYDMYTILSSKKATELYKLKLIDQFKITHNKVKVKS